MKYTEFVQQIVQEVEQRFNTLSFANWASNSTDTHRWWEVGIDKPEVYGSAEYKAYCREKRECCKRLFGKDFLLFKLQTVNEEVLTRYLSQGLIMNCK